MKTDQTKTRIQALGELFFQLSDDEQRIARCLYQQLATAKPVELQVLSRQTGVPLSTTVDTLKEWPGVYFNDAGAVIGFWGLAIDPVSSHQIVIDDVTLYGWCAWDTLFIPVLIGKTCQVLAKCKQTGEPIRLEVSPNGVECASPETVHLSYVLPDEAEFDRDVVTSFCHFVHFFRDRETAETWSSKQDGGFVLDLEDSVAAAHHKIKYEYQWLAVAS
ncbi:MAG TPA: organomercurial lyase [Woeseiaceae bacterium]|nr:organomercurial lyase [Woeseiaceae bacterium]